MSAPLALHEAADAELLERLQVNKADAGRQHQAAQDLATVAEDFECDHDQCSVVVLELGYLPACFHESIIS